MDALAKIGCLEDRDIIIDGAAMELAAADRSFLELGPANALISEWASRLPRCHNADERAAALSHLLYDQEGFTGDEADYDAPRNADFLSVLDRRRGLPITLAILYVGLARRVGWPARVLGLPGHVLVVISGDGQNDALPPEEDIVLIDAFKQGLRLPYPSHIPLTLADRARRPGDGVILNNRESLVRLVMNQASRARSAGDPIRALLLYRRLTRIAPMMTTLWWEQARLEQLANQPAAARRSLAAMSETTRDRATLRRIQAAIETLAR